MTNLKNYVLGMLNEQESAPQEQPVTKAIGSREFIDSIKQDLGISENSGSYDTKPNPVGAMGKYQFMRSRLSDLGYGDISPETFTPEVQEEVMDKHVNDLIEQGRKRGYITDSTSPEDAAGLIWAGHLGGMGGMRDAFQGNVGASDMFGTSTSAYYKKGRQKFLERAGGVVTNQITPTGMMRNAARNISNNPSEDERVVLEEVAKLGDTNYARNTAEIRSLQEQFKQHSTFSEAVSAYYEQDKFNYHTQLSEIKSDLYRNASSELRNSLTGKVDQADIDKLVSPLERKVLIGPEDARAIQDYTKNVQEFKQKYPNISLKYENLADINKLVSAEYDKRAERWNNVYRGEWTDDVGTALTKLGTLIGGYLPAIIANMVQDPPAVLSNSIGGGVVKGGKLFFEGAKVGIAETVRSFSVDNQLEGTTGEKTVGEILGYGASAGASFIALSALGKGLANLWSRSSKGSEKVLDDIAKAAEEIEKKGGEAAPVANQIKETAEFHKEQLSKNPYGKSSVAKEKFEPYVKAATEDLLAGRPVRAMAEPPRVFIPVDETPIRQLMKTAVGDELESLKSQLQVAKNLNQIRLMEVQPRIIEDPQNHIGSFVPLVNKKELGTNTLYRFDTTDEAMQFLRRTPEGRNFLKNEEVLIVAGQSVEPGKGKFFLARAAEVEPTNTGNTAITRAAKDEVFEKPGVGKTVEDPEALELASQFPRESRISPRNTAEIAQHQKELLEAVGNEPAALTGLNRRIEKAEEQLAKDFDPEAIRISEREIEVEGNLSPDELIDIGDEVPELITKKEWAERIREEKKVLQEFSDCIKGKSA